MRNVQLIAWETFRLLRRDRIFVPAWFVFLLISLFASLASDWSLEDFDKVLLDVGFFGFQMLGGAVAVFWGTKTMSDAVGSGALEVQLAAPVGRTQWLVGRYLGLGIALCTLGVGLGAAWTVANALRGTRTIDDTQLVAMAFTVLGWLVLAAMAVAMSCYASQGVAVFATLSLWVSGLASSLVYATLPEHTADSLRRLVRTVSHALNLQAFNLVDWATGMVQISHQELVYRAAYGFVLIGFFMGLGAFGWNGRDIGGGA